MYVGILSSASEEIDDYYRGIAKSVANFLAKNEYNLVFGGSSKSMMGICYHEFKKEDRDILAFTTKKYLDELDGLKCKQSIVCESTFDVKKEIYENSDVLVFLPGGVGTFSELFSFLQENVGNERQVPIEIYDEDGYYLPFIEQLQIMVVKGFADSSILECFKVSHDKNEFIDHMSDYERGNKYER